MQVTDVHTPNALPTLQKTATIREDDEDERRSPLNLIAGLVAASDTEITQVAISFGLLLIIALALNLQWIAIRAPNPSVSVSVMMGGLALSTISTRLTFLIVSMAGFELLPYLESGDWVYNNDENVRVITDGFLKTRPELCIAILLFTLAVSLALGAGVGYLISGPATRMRPTHFMIFMMPLAGLLHAAALSIPTLSGGRLGVYVPDVLAFYGGDRAPVLASMILSVGAIVLVVSKHLLKSPFSKFMMEIRGDVVVSGRLESRVSRIRRDVIVFTSGLMAVAGAFLSFHYSFVVQANYVDTYWMYRSLLMVLIGGLGSYAGTFLGTFLVIVLNQTIIVYKTTISRMLFFPIGYFERLLLAVLTLVFLILRQKDHYKKNRSLLGIQGKKNRS